MRGLALVAAIGMTSTTAYEWIVNQGFADIVIAEFKQSAKSSDPLVLLSLLPMLQSTCKAQIALDHMEKEGVFAMLGVLLATCSSLLQNSLLETVSDMARNEGYTAQHFLAVFLSLF